jgi:hypothetical protein
VGKSPCPIAADIDIRRGRGEKDQQYRFSIPSQVDFSIIGRHTNQ